MTPSSTPIIKKIVDNFNKKKDSKAAYVVPWKSGSFVVGAIEKNGYIETYLVTPNGDVKNFLISANENDFIKASKNLIKL